MDPLPEAQLYHVTNVENRTSILQEGLKARAGSWFKTAWKPRVFFATSKLAAYEMAMIFMHERKGDYLIVRIDPAKLRGKLRPDRDYDHGVWIARDVLPDTIIGVDDVDEDFLESKEYRTYMWGDEDEDEDDDPE